jgi:hypothetical protein
MFCGNCGSEAVEGDRFCITCGRQQRSPSTTVPAEVALLDRSLTPALDGALPVGGTVSAGGEAEQPGEKPLYCRHNAPARTRIGVDREHGSEICLGCRLPYSPGSPNSQLRVVARTTVPAGVKPTSEGFTNPASPALSPPFSGNAIAAFVLSLFWLGGIGSIVAIFLAASAMKDVRRGTHSGQGLAVAALVLGIVGVVLSVVVISQVMLMGQDLSNQFNQISDCVNSPTAPGCP